MCIRDRTTQHLLLFTNLGNAIYRPIHELTDTKWKDIGEHLSQTLTNFEQEEEILFAEIVDQFEGVIYFAATQQGQIKRFERKELSPWRTYRSKSTKYAKLKDQDDRIVACLLYTSVKGRRRTDKMASSATVTLENEIILVK